MQSLFILCLVALVAIATSRAQMTTQTGMTADAHCGQGYCFTGVYVPQHSLINYTLVVPNGGADIGWFGVAQGTQMKGANMAINWANSDGSLTTSHRSATKEEYPVESLASGLPSLTINDVVSPSSSSQTIWSWSFVQSIPPSNKMAHIFASSQKSPQGKASSSGIPMHDYHEYPITLDMTKVYDGSAPAGLAASGSTMKSSSAATSAHRDLSQNITRLFLVHMILMIVAWMLVLPVGIFVARLGRTLSTWFPAHRAIQSIATLLILIGAALAIVGIHSRSGDHFSSNHARSGLIVIVILILQVILGGSAHYYRGKTGKRYIGYLHMPLGILLIGFSIYTIHLGFDIWHWNPPKAASYFIYAWSGLLLFAYVAGFALLPKEREQTSQGDNN